MAIQHKLIKGFTLIELMITVAIIGILAAIAYPSYRDSVLKAKRAEGKAALTRLMQSEERFYTGNNTYLVSTDARFIASNGFSLYSGDSAANAAYTIAAALSTTACGSTTAAGECVVLTATSVQPDAKCSVMTLNSAGIKTSSPVTTCWQ